ncbi:hypothetical protein DFP94_1011185 [Fontibacillus phaseoli]|uniref:Uncharacterized protein n=1 Tax=Fontibacillus phaseoli TaxID=1416533 RepID=A0A369BSL9_9BACL|nr:hypothetical protein DFP94_1011185 [Fontibacillus phaseoli]
MRYAHILHLLHLSDDKKQLPKRKLFALTY